MSTQEIAQTTQKIANRLTELCRAGKFMEVYDELFAENAASIEPKGSALPTAEGKEAMRKKGQQFSDSMVEFHGSYINDPIIAGNHFALAMGIDVTMKDGNRMKLDEICVYKIENGKIVSEQFFY